MSIISLETRRAVSDALQIANAAGSPPRGVFEPVQAPWIRPGVVVHDSEASIDGLLAEFALTLRGRGFNVVGFVQSNNRGCSGTGEGCAPRIDYFDLATSRTIPVRRDAAESHLRRAMREDADLLVISRFSACVEATREAKAMIGADAGQGMPMLTSIAGGCIHKFHSYARHDGAMLSPDLKSLWNWWGPDRLYRDLVLGVAEDETRRIVCGNRWILVEGPHGTGLSYLPKHPRELFPKLAALARKGLHELARLALSWNPVESALGLAAINAHYNRYDLDARAGNGVRSLRSVDGRVVVIGAFPGIDDILPGAAVIETAPRPGEYPPHAMETLLPSCGGAVVNSSSLVNRNLSRILKLTRGRPLALIGPSTPMTPRLRDYGVSVMSGLIVHDPDGLAAAVRAGALPREFGQFGRFVHLS